MTQTRQHLHTVLNRLSLARPRFSRDDDTLFVYLIDHSRKGSPSHRKDVRHFGAVAIENGLLDLLHESRAEEIRNLLVGVERDEGGSNRGEDLVLFIPLDEVVEDDGLVETAHQAHIVMRRRPFFHQFLYFQ